MREHKSFLQEREKTTRLNSYRWRGTRIPTRVVRGFCSVIWVKAFEREAAAGERDTATLSTSFGAAKGGHDF
jgi:hypothetical protein